MFTLCPTGEYCCKWVHPCRTVQFRMLLCHLSVGVIVNEYYYYYYYYFYHCFSYSVRVCLSLVGIHSYVWELLGQLIPL